jgi:flavin-dependent dehydrogenase
MPTRATYDVVVLGAGPAGSAAATLLARNGRQVAVVRPATPPAAALPESVPPSARRILEELGFQPWIEGAGFHAARGHTVWWAGAAERRETFANEAAGFHTDREALERTLVAVAARAGAEVLDGTSARSATAREHGWVVACDGEAVGKMEIEATWVIDATGRRGVLARLAGRLPDRSTSTLALVRRWRHRGGWPAEHAHRTLVESYSDGWAWSVPLDDEVRCFAAMIDGGSGERPEDPPVRGRRSVPDAAEILEGELAKTRHLGPLRLGAEPDGPAWACSASLYTASRFARQGLLLAGDAASAIDPLSSFGVKKALSSGWLAGIVANTALAEPAWTGEAIAFYERREREVYRRYRILSAPFFDEAARAYGTPYWERRARAAREAVENGAGHDRFVDADPDAWGETVPEEAVRDAFERIRALPALAARPGSSLRTVRRLAVERDRLVPCEHLASDACPEGLRWVRGVDLHRLVATVPSHAEVSEAWAAYNGTAPPVTLPDFLSALAAAFAAGFLEHASP